MANILTTAAGRMAAKAWFHDVALAGGIISASQRPAGDAMARRLNDPTFVNNAKIVCDELVNRDFANIDHALYRLSSFRFIPTMDNSAKNLKHVDREVLAKYIVYMASLLGLYWDDTIRTPYEINEFKNTLFGNTVFNYKQVISAIPDAPVRKRASSASSSSSSAAVAVKAPQNNYKQSGPQSINVRDLRDETGFGVGVAGKKLYAENPEVFKIIGDGTGKNVPNLFIKPLSASGATPSGTNKVFFSSGNGYTDCTCWFDDPNVAAKFLQDYLASGKCPNNVTNPRIAKYKADKNGYFLVGTEFGTVAISAKTLNEAINNSNESIETEEQDNLNEASTGWEAATADLTAEERKELHTWMRRG